MDQLFPPPSHTGQPPPPASHTDQSHRASQAVPRQCETLLPIWGGGGDVECILYKPGRANNILFRELESSKNRIPERTNDQERTWICRSLLYTTRRKFTTKCKFKCNNTTHDLFDPFLFFIILLFRILIYNTYPSQFLYFSCLSSPYHTPIAVHRHNLAVWNVPGMKAIGKLSLDLYGSVRNAVDAGSILYEGKWEGAGPWKFLGPVKWHRADRRVPFGAQKTCLHVHTSIILYLTCAYQHTYVCVHTYMLARDRPRRWRAHERGFRAILWGVGGRCIK